MSPKSESIVRRVLPFVAVVALVAVANVAGRIGDHYRAARLARGEGPPSLDPHLFGIFLVAGALAIALQTLYTYKHGWVYGHFWRKIYRDDQPTQFRFGLWLQITFVLLLTFLGLRGLLS